MFNSDLYTVVFYFVSKIFFFSKSYVFEVLLFLFNWKKIGIFTLIVFTDQHNHSSISK